MLAIYLFIYLVLCQLLFIFAVLTTMEDKIILIKLDEHGSECNFLILLMIFLICFFPLVNILLLIVTLLYRRGLM